MKAVMPTSSQTKRQLETLLELLPPSDLLFLELIKLTERRLVDVALRAERDERAQVSAA